MDTPERKRRNALFMVVAVMFAAVIMTAATVVMFVPNGRGESERNGLVANYNDTRKNGQSSYSVSSNGRNMSSLLYVTRAKDGGGLLVIFSFAFRWFVAAVAVVGLMVCAFIAAYLFRLRRRKIRELAVAEERKRMAGDLHDTIEQHLAGISLTVNSVLRREDGLSESSRNALTAAVEMVASAKSEVRIAVMNLRSDVLQRQTLAEALTETAKRLSAGGDVEVRCRTGALPEGLSATVKVNVLAIVQEAVTNALKHGRAKKVLISARRRGKRGGNGFSVSVLNDGEAFNPAEAPGPMSGHFGLSGMKDRAVKLGGRLKFLNRGGVVTVRLEVDE